MEIWRVIRKRLAIISIFHMLGCFSLFSGFVELSDRGYWVNVILVTLWPIGFVVEANIFAKRFEKKTETLNT